MLPMAHTLGRILGVRLHELGVVVSEQRQLAHEKLHLRLVRLRVFYHIENVRNHLPG